jgi:hypothetical protein
MCCLFHLLWGLPPARQEWSAVIPWLALDIQTMPRVEAPRIAPISALWHKHRWCSSGTSCLLYRSVALVLQPSHNTSKAVPGGFLIGSLTHQPASSIQGLLEQC